MSELITCLNGRRVLDRDYFHEEFSTEDYLRDFYTRIDDQAMQFVLNFLPNMVARIGKVDRVLDFGAGPTIHVAVSFRNNAKEIYLADYLPQNRNELLKWHNKSSVFEWNETLKILAKCEGAIYTELSTMEQAARDKVKGIFHCDCFKDPSVDAPNNLLGTFNVSSPEMTPSTFVLGDRHDLLRGVLLQNAVRVQAVHREHRQADRPWRPFHHGRHPRGDLVLLRRPHLHLSLHHAGVHVPVSPRCGPRGRRPEGFRLLRGQRNVPRLRQEEEGVNLVIYW
uniref:NNMT/PNMT/TEMT family protein n=1 Tax=Steinernema glaseri TaxID=37863 RepID=A0A1I7Y0V8_9BILA